MVARLCADQMEAIHDDAMWTVETRQGNCSKKLSEVVETLMDNSFRSVNSGSAKLHRRVS